MSHRGTNKRDPSSYPILSSREIRQHFDRGILHFYHPSRSFSYIRPDETGECPYAVHSETADAYFDENKHLHRDELPAFTRRTAYGTIQEWYDHGRLHNPSGYAVIRFNHDGTMLSAERWYLGLRSTSVINGKEYYTTSDKAAWYGD